MSFVYKRKFKIRIKFGDKEDTKNNNRRTERGVTNHDALNMRQVLVAR